MKTTLEKTYQCEFCKKKGRSAGAMARHERFCKFKPENKHKCFDYCKFLKRTSEILPNSDPESSYSYKTVFTCQSTGLKMYSVLLEKRVDFEPEFIEGLSRMPLQCNMYESMNYIQIEERYNPEP